MVGYTPGTDDRSAPQIAMDRRGAGPPMVLLHGVGSRRGVFDPIVPALAAGHTVYAIDLPGFGDSSAPAGLDASIDGLTDQVAGLCTRLGLDRPHVVGNSMGGAIALELGRREIAGTVTAFAPAGFWTPGELRRTRTLLSGARTLARARPAVAAAARSRLGRVGLVGLFYGRPTAVPAVRVRADADALVRAPAFPEALRRFVDYDLVAGPRPPAGLADIPVTVVWGRRDRVLPHQQAGRAQQALPGSRHLSLPGAGHLPFHDDPEACAAAVLGR